MDCMDSDDDDSDDDELGGLQLLEGSVGGGIGASSDKAAMSASVHEFSTLFFLFNFYEECLKIRHARIKAAADDSNSILRIAAKDLVAIQIAWDVGFRHRLSNALVLHAREDIN